MLRWFRQGKKPRQKCRLEIDMLKLLMFVSGILVSSMAMADDGIDIGDIDNMGPKASSSVFTLKGVGGVCDTLADACYQGPLTTTGATGLVGQMPSELLDMDGSRMTTDDPTLGIEDTLK
jgi:hypothetical protein